MAENGDPALRTINEISREILDLDTVTLSPRDALEKIIGWQMALRPSRKRSTHPCVPPNPLQFDAASAGQEDLSASQGNGIPKVAPPNFSAALDAGLNLFVDTRPIPTAPPPGFEEALKAGLGKLLADTGVKLQSLPPKPKPIPIPVQTPPAAKKPPGDDWSHRPSSTKVAKFLGLSQESARQRIHYTRHVNREVATKQPRHTFAANPSKLLQKKKKNKVTANMNDKFGPGTLVEVVLDNGDRSRATVIDYVSKSSSYRVSFQDFSVLTVQAKKVTKLADNPAVKCLPHTQSEPSMSHYKSAPAVMKVKEPEPTTLGGVPVLGPPSDKPRNSVARRPDVLPPPKFAPSGDRSNSKWMSAPPPSNPASPPSKKTNTAQSEKPRKNTIAPAQSEKEKGIKAGEEAIAIFSYDGGREDELTVKPGQKVQVLQAFNDGWVLGRLSTTRHVGVLPGNFLAHPDSAAAISAIAAAGNDDYADW